jgi:hypothetical protein
MTFTFSSNPFESQYFEVVTHARIEQYAGAISSQLLGRSIDITWSPHPFNIDTFMVMVLASALTIADLTTGWIRTTASLPAADEPDALCSSDFSW